MARQDEKGAFARDSAAQGVRDQWAELAKRARPCQEQVAPLLADPRTRQRVEELDQREKERGRRAAARGQLSVLGWAAGPAAKEVCERFLERYVADDHAPIAAETCFPLPGADPATGPPQKFPWARAGGGARPPPGARPAPARRAGRQHAPPRPAAGEPAEQAGPRRAPGPLHRLERAPAGAVGERAAAGLPGRRAARRGRA